ncbi:hypothetical protein [Neofamilia massiliensis]|uniref:hypothetical protein n=1 Tax=Neofamilia massiliensis TaxID=1673724 RepID=UPI0006BB9504|nr:hypothetical protein [Neofamilia massiliensis]
MKKKILLLSSLVLIVILFTVNSNVKALEFSNDEVLRWENNYNTNISLSKRNNTIYIDSIVKVDNVSSSISGGVYLERYTNGRWVNVASWVIKGKGSAILSDSYKGVSGELYRARLSADVGGERISATSNSVRL